MSAKTYTFVTGGKEYTIPSYRQIPMRALRRALDEDDRIKQSFIILEHTVKDKKTFEALEDMTVEEFTDFIEKWAATEEASLGD